MRLHLCIRKDSEQGRETSLRVAVDHQHVVTSQTEALGQRDRRRGLGHAPLEVRDGNGDRFRAGWPQSIHSQLACPLPDLSQLELTPGTCGIQRAGGEGAPFAYPVVDLTGVEIYQASELRWREAWRLLHDIRS